MPSAAAIDALERRGDEAAHEVGAGADVDGADGDGRALELRVLAHVERADRLQPGDDDHQVDDDREHRPADEDVGELHVSGSRGAGRARASGLTLLSTTTGASLRSLNAPALTTSCPALTPLATATKSPRASPSAHELLARDLDRLAVRRLGHAGRVRLLRLDHEHRVAVRRVHDRGRAARRPPAAAPAAPPATLTNMPGRSLSSCSGIAGAELARCASSGRRSGRSRVIVPSAAAAAAPSIVTRTGMPDADGAPAPPAAA